jgi:hypothetical protein
MNRDVSSEGSMNFDAHLGLVGSAGLRPTALASIDTSLILDQAAARLGANIQIVQSMGMGSIRHFAPMRVADELAWNYRAAARRRRVDPEGMYRLLTEDFMPRIRFVDLPPFPAGFDGRLDDLTALDSDGADPDVAYLGLLLSPSVVFSRERDLRQTGFAPATLEELDLVLAAGLSLEISDGALVATGFVANLGAAGASSVANAIAVRFQIPLWVVVLAAIAAVGFGTYWALSTPERRDKVGRLLAPAAEEVAKLVERRAAAKVLLERTSIHSASDSFENRVFRALAFSREPLLASELRSLLVATGPVPDERWLRQYLTTHPSFVRRRAHRWQLGRQMTIVRRAHRSRSPRSGNIKTRLAFPPTVWVIEASDVDTRG